MAGLYGQGVRVPDDVALIGFDDRRYAMLSAPPLTTVAQPSRNLGMLAADLLLQRLNGVPMPAGGSCQSLPTQLVVREST